MKGVGKRSVLEGVRQVANRFACGKVIVVFGSSRSRLDESTRTLFFSLLNRMSFERVLLVNGGYLGTMLESALSYREAGGHTVGVVCANVSDCIEHSAFDEVIVASDHWVRLEALVEVADGFIVLPGGVGTEVELTSILWCADRGFLSHRPIAIMGNRWKDLLIESLSDPLYLRSQQESVLFVEAQEHIDAFVEKICDHPLKSVADSSGQQPIDAHDWWEASLGSHIASDYYNCARFVEDKDCLTVDADIMSVLGDVKGRRILHLQCNFGLDTLSLARLGASVVGADVNELALDYARNLASSCGLAARFVQWDANAGALSDATAPADFEIVFASYGVLDWVKDTERYFSEVHKVLGVGGKLVLVDVHPAAKWLARTGASSHSYCFEGEVVESGVSYADGQSYGPIQASYRPLSSILTSCARSGLVVERVIEAESSAHKFHRSMTEFNGRWKMRDQFSGSPLIFGLVARKAP